METYYCDYIDVKPLGSFTTIFFAKQKFGEVDPNFIRQFGDELPSQWKIMDYRFEHHVVTYNKDEVHPLVTDGWKDMRDVFDLHQNEVIEFAYHGQGLFGIMASRRFESEDQIPDYHSRSVSRGNSVRFQVELTRDNMSNPYLSIWNAFEIYVRNSNLNVITACCDNGTKTEMQFAKQDNPFWMTALGPGWFGFCRKNGFRAGDQLCFNFSLVNCGNNVVRVFKI
ncbi:uncharacterized protein LOC123903843 [Trifolium pratense]|uniref:uncharacterized protein LOC123894779 n=1 Tax=Trifolium pratense TaxID=57577 RepID=UPI001E693E59|nr:uncharacterized protein LOC123894779 [Trifolium pratense]XP_045809455.1 uncharacterized protein LOC123903843 [Trifolium pratense]